MKNTKLVGGLVALAIVGLSFGDALTGHGIKGNKNLNPIVVGDGSSSSSSSSSSGGKKYKTETTTVDCTVILENGSFAGKTSKCIEFTSGECFLGCIVAKSI